MKKHIKSLFCTLLSVLLILSVFAGCSNDVAISVAETITQADDVIENLTTDAGSTEPVTVSNEVQQLAEDTKEAVADEQDIATDELAPIPDNESNIVDEGAIEPDAQVEQENISYDGTNTGNGLSLLGKCTGLTYYSQADSRWANLLYTSTGNKSQTMKSSACGPTSAAMVVSSSKGVILPTTMAQLFVDNGYRTANNGTAWACWSFVADYFDFDEYYTTTSDSKMLSYLNTDKNKDGVADYFVVASCGNGLFTTGGHYIVLIADNEGTITVYDPYLYYGKFNTASRRSAGVTVSGNSAFVSETSFKRYANTKQYWIFSNDNDTSNKSTNSTTSVSYTRYVATQNLPLTVRNSPGGTVVRTLPKGTKVNVIATSGSWSQIGENEWVSTSYLSASPVKEEYKTSIGKSYRLKEKSTLYSNGNLTGTKYEYLAKTEVKVLSHYSDTVDYVICVKTGRKAYLPIDKITAVSSSAPKTTTTSTSTGIVYVYIPATGRYAYCKKSAIGSDNRLKKNTTLYSKSSLTGTTYQYLAKTKVTIKKTL